VEVGISVLKLAALPPSKALSRQPVHAACCVGSAAAPAADEAGGAGVASIDRSRRRFIYKSEGDARATYPGKDSGKHRGMITSTAESVFGALLYLTEKCGRVFPSLEGLAHLAMYLP
jgi:hypothetical protein